jgi:predicted metalloprotease
LSFLYQLCGKIKDFECKTTTHCVVQASQYMLFAAQNKSMQLTTINETTYTLAEIFIEGANVYRVPALVLFRPGVTASSLDSSIISSIAAQIRNTSALEVSC